MASSESQTDRIEARHPDPEKEGVRILPWKVTRVAGASPQRLVRLI